MAVLRRRVCDPTSEAAYQRSGSRRIPCVSIERAFLRRGLPRVSTFPRMRAGGDQLPRDQRPGSSRDDCDSSDRSVPIHFPDFGARRGGRAQSHLTLWSQLALSVAVLTVVVGTVPPTCAASVGTPVRSSVRHSLLPQATRDRSPGASSARPCRRGPPEP